jgi:hypothetical protein
MTLSKTEIHSLAALLVRSMTLMRLANIHQA